MNFSEILRSQTETNYVRFPAEMILPVFGSFVPLDNETGQIDLNVVEDFYIQLLNRQIGEKWLRVYDEGASVCLMELVSERGKKRVKCTQIECVSGKQKAVLVYLARKKRASIEDLAVGVWHDESANRKTISSTISHLSSTLHQNDVGIDVARADSERYSIIFC